MKSPTIRIRRPADPFQPQIDACKARRHELSFDEVSALIAHDPETGKLLWKKRHAETFWEGRQVSPQYCRAWNTRYAGKEALASINSTGYRTGFISCRPYKAHRVMWLLCTGSWPEAQIDHINGDRKDNRIINLREVTQAENMKNKAKQTNSSGAVGIRWRDNRQKWEAHIKSGGRQHFLGRFDNLSDAKHARQLAEQRFGFHKNHGRPSGSRDHPASLPVREFS